MIGENYEAISDEELIALELRYWNAIHTAPRRLLTPRKLRWAEILKEVRRRKLFDRLVW